MADPTTVNRGYAIPTRGSDVGVWDTPINGDFNLIDQNLGAVATVAVSNSNVTLTPEQYACGTIRLTGALTVSVGVFFPAVQGWWTIDNQTTGAFLAVITTGAGQNIVVDQGSAADILIDGANVKFRNLPPVGTYLDICDATVPAWITACTVPPYLNCTGATFNATTYPYLNAKLGGNTLPDFRGVSRATLNQGTSRITTAGSGIDGNTRFSIGGGQNQTLTLAQLPTGITSPFSNGATSQGVVLASAVTGFSLSSFSANAGAQVWQAFNQGAVINQVNLAISGVAISNNTSGQFHPIMQPTTISGLTLIRAA